jgi:hypothetical protein
VYGGVEEVAVETAAVVAAVNVATVAVVTVMKRTSIITLIAGEEVKNKVNVRAPTSSRGALAQIDHISLQSSHHAEFHTIAAGLAPIRTGKQAPADPRIVGFVLMFLIRKMTQKGTQFTSQQNHACSSTTPPILRKAHLTNRTQNHVSLLTIIQTYNRIFMTTLIQMVTQSIIQNVFLNLLLTQERQVRKTISSTKRRIIF